VKLECDTVGRGWFPPPGYQDNLVVNRWTSALKPVLPGRVEVLLMPPPTVGRQPNLGHIARALMPRRFYVQLNTDDLHMIVVPPWFQDALREWIKIPLPRSVPLSACRFCYEWVQVTHHGGHVVFGQNWAQVVYKYDLHIGDIAVVKLQAFIL
jgi:hypothetical protein